MKSYFRVVKIAFIVVAFILLMWMFSRTTEEPPLQEVPHVLVPGPPGSPPIPAQPVVTLPSNNQQAKNLIQEAVQPSIQQIGEQLSNINQETQPVLRSLGSDLQELRQETQPVLRSLGDNINVLDQKVDNVDSKVNTCVNKKTCRKWYNRDGSLISDDPPGCAAEFASAVPVTNTTPSPLPIPRSEVA